MIQNVNFLGKCNNGHIDKKMKIDELFIDYVAYHKHTLLPHE